ncbi:MAG: hypothetical protein NTW21_35090 [Verrucomicrobia bacterium]|nr:hypothetical protein [Verrucomicrobiota bacterium]
MKRGANIPDKALLEAVEIFAKSYDLGEKGYSAIRIAFVRQYLRHRIIEGQCGSPTPFASESRQEVRSINWRDHFLWKGYVAHNPQECLTTAVS